MDRPLAPAGGSRFRLAPFILFLLLSTFALSLHVQLGRYDHLSSFSGKHILHGDLRPNGDKPVQNFAEAHGATVSALAVSVSPHISSLSRLISNTALPSSETSVRKLLSYLALFVRPPPILP